MSSRIRSLDFDIVKEPWNKYELGDNTILKTRVILKGVRKITQGNDTNYDLDFQNIQATIVPNDVKGTPASRVYSMQEIQSSQWTDTRYNTIAEEWNEYIVDDGSRIRLKSTVTNVRKSDKFTQDGDPIYSANVNVLPQIIPPKIQ